MDKGDGLAVAGVMIRESPEAKDVVLPELFEIVPKLSRKSLCYLMISHIHLFEVLKLLRF